MTSKTGVERQRHRSSPSQWEIGDLIAAYLQQLGVDYVFGVPGGAIEPLYNALARSDRAGGPRPIVSRHETGAAFMADGYNRQTGKLGVCCATTGPGATNLITGVSSAYENYVPMLVITAQTALSHFGRGAFQESSCTGINTVGMFQYCTRYNTLVSHPDQFERKLVAAVMSAHQSPTGPAHLSIPLDVLRSSVTSEGPSYQLDRLLTRTELMDQGAVDELCRQIEEADKIVLVIGNGCSEAIGAILELAILIDAKIVTTPDGKGLVSPYHPLFRGVVGFAGHQSATDVLLDPEVDIVVAVGTSFGEWSSNAWDSRALLNDRLIHVDLMDGHLARSPMAKLHVSGRVGAIFDQVLAYVGQVMREDAGRSDPEQKMASLAEMVTSAGGRRCFRLDEETKYRDDSAPIKPQRLMRDLPRMFPPSTRFLADVGNSMAWGIHYLHPFDRRIAGRRGTTGGVFRSCLEFSSMGWAIGAAVGTALGCRGHPVVCITGDGSLLMSGQELTVAVQEELPVIFIILNDAGLGMVKHGQRLAGAERVGFELPSVDFCALANAMGAAAYIVQSPADLEQFDVAAACHRAGPTLLDVRVDPEEAPPMAVRMRGLAAVESDA